MQSDLMNSMKDISKQAVESARDLGELNSKMIEKAIEQQMSITNMCVESGMKQVQLLQETRDVKEFWSKQASLVEEYAGKLMEAAKQQVEFAQKAGEEYKSWIEQGVKQATDTAKASTKKSA